MSEWKPIETAPKDRKILLCNPGDHPVVAGWGYAFIGRFNREKRELEDVYGWMTIGTSSFIPGRNAVWHDLPHPALSEEGTT